MVRPIVFGIRSRGTTRWAPRLGRIRIDAPLNGWSGSAAHTPVASTTARVRISSSAPVVRSSARSASITPDRAIRPETGGPDPGDDHAAGGDRRPGHGQRVARVVLHPVVVDEAAAKTLGPQGRGKVERVGLRQPAVPAAVVTRTEDVVQGQPGVVERLRRERDAVDREQQRLDPDEVWRERQQARPLGERLAHEPEPELLEVAQTAVDEPRRARRRPGRDVVLLDERRAHPARDRVEQRTRPDDPATDDDDVPGLGGERSEVDGPADSSGGVAGAGVVTGGSIMPRAGRPAGARCATAATPCRRSAR